LQDYGAVVDVCDPCADRGEARETYGIDLLETPESGAYDGIVLAVAHDLFRGQGATVMQSYGANPHVFYDLKSEFDINESDLRL
jgi:UDP-N-acetyl-D-galactosamine dehydrogenase